MLTLRLAIWVVIFAVIAVAVIGGFVMRDDPSGCGGNAHCTEEKLEAEMAGS